MRTAISRRDVIRHAQGLALTPFLGLVACDGASIVVAGATMGTTYSVRIPVLPARLDRRALERDIARILETVNRQMSTFRPESELSRFNAAPSASWTEVSPDTLAVVAKALSVSRITDGAFDPTVGPFVDLWGFGPGGGPSVPPAHRIAETRGRVGHRALRARATPPALSKTVREVRIDLSGIAKGFAVDKVAEHLARSGVDSYLVEIGGELRGRGYSRRGEPWRVAIERPHTAATAERLVGLGSAALATSGDWRIFFERAGARYSHIIDPRTGRPVAPGLASVTVIAPTAMAADAWSTALMVLGPEAGPELARRNGISALFIAESDGGFAEIIAPQFARYLVA